MKLHILNRDPLLIKLRSNVKRFSTSLSKFLKELNTVDWFFGNYSLTLSHRSQNKM